MDIHNTESTNLLLANNEIKFYLTYKDFMDNYPKHLKKWLELQSPYGEEKDFKEEYIQIYAPFFEDYGINGLDFEGFSGKYYGYDVMSGSYNYYNRFFNISLYHDFLKDETDVLRINDNNPAQVLTSEYQKFRDVEYEKVKGEFYYFSYEVRRVLNTFFVWNKETQTIIFDKLKYRNFTKNIKKIVTFLLSDELYTNNNPLSESNAPKKETLHFEPLPVSEPQQAEPTQEPQPVPNFGEAQPIPVVSEEPQPEDITPLQWNGTDIEFIELAKALEVSGVVTSEKHPFINIVRVLKKAFNFELQNHYKKANDIKLRKIGGETLFLDKLQKELKDKWINKEK
ncbi:RteC domain-containing protein [Capnocytophaga canis]|uniref:RteC domain-containing protein n=1 Tax=Capnocytophaga canis TaxID=1848903 RepID=UPI00370D32B8